MKDNELLEQQPAADSVTEQEVPFVPYVTEALEESGKKKRPLWMIVSICVLAVVVLIYIILAAVKKNNFYQKTVAALEFDYRYGESVMGESADGLKKGEKAKEIYAQMENHGVSVHAVQYFLRDDRSMEADIAEYQFTHNGEGDTAEIEIGTVDGIASRKQTVRKTSSGGMQIQKGGTWENASDISLPFLYEYCFAVSPSGSMSIQYKETFETFVSGKNMVCEIWLMNIGSAYYTVYRYYNGSTLEAVRVLSKADDLMCIYDIRDYSIL